MTSHRIVAINLRRYHVAGGRSGCIRCVVDGLTWARQNDSPLFHNLAIWALGFEMVSIDSLLYDGARTPFCSDVSCLAQVTQTTSPAQTAFCPHAPWSELAGGNTQSWTVPWRSMSILSAQLFVSRMERRAGSPRCRTFAYHGAWARHPGVRLSGARQTG